MTALYLTARREYSGGAVQQVTTTDMTSSNLIVSIDGSTNWPTAAAAPGGFFVLVAEGTAAEEKMLISARTTNQLTVATRGVDGSTAFAHPAGAKIRCWYAAQDADEANAHTSAANGVHGVQGFVLGNLDVQSVYNKTFDGTNTITDHTLMTHDHSNTVNAGPTAKGTLQAPTYSTGWSAGVVGTPGFRVDSSRWVKVQGSYAAAGGATATVATGFPAPVDGSNHFYTAVDAFSNGIIVAQVSSGGVLSLNSAGNPVTGHTYCFEFGYQS